MDLNGLWTLAVLCSRPGSGRLEYRGGKEAVSTDEVLISQLVAKTGHLEILTLIMPRTWSVAYKAQPVFAE